METLFRIAELLGTAFAASWITRLLTIKARVRQEKAGASKAEAEAKADEIENIRQTMDAVYKPIIEDLKKQVAELRGEVRDVRQENERLKAENGELRDALREIRLDLVPTRRESNARKQPRKDNGQFKRKEDE